MKTAWFLGLATSLIACTNGGNAPDFDTGAGPLDDTGVPGPELGFVLLVDAPILRVVQGASARMGVTVSRTDGYQGPVDVEVAGLPVGVTATPLTVPEAAPTGELELIASPSATLGGPSLVTVAGTGDEGDAEAVAVPLYVVGTPGTQDPSFSFDGTLTYTAVAGGRDGVDDLALDGRGRLVVAGTSYGRDCVGFLLRFDAAGALDTSFGTDGAGPDFGPDSWVYHVAIRSGDRPLVMARLADQQTVLEAVEDDGTRESTWGAAGRVSLRQDDAYLHPGPLLPSTGRILAVLRDDVRDYDAPGDENLAFPYEEASLATFGSATLDAQEHLLLGSGSGPYGVERRRPDGTLDEGFGNGGVLSFGAPEVTAAWVTALAATADGGGVGLGTTIGSIPSDPLLFRFDDDGELDPAFGNGGVVSLAEGPALYDALAVQADGKIVVGGGDFPTDRVERFNPDGSPNPDFGVDGTVPVAGPVQAIALEPGPGRILVAVGDGDTAGFDVVRLWQ